ncbi:MAG: DUF401 family protein [Limnochordia bacterium]|jgi:integral membrane protein (TIGR00529 family)
MATALGLVAGVTIILTGVKRKVHIGLTAALAAVVLSLFSGQAWSVLKVSLVETLLAPSNRTLLLAIALITILGRTMQVSGAMTALADSTQKLFRSPKGTILVLSSLMGFLSVPGASIFSAPMVDASGRQLGMSTEQRAVANVYFRHLWYLIYPLYPPFILLQQMSGIPYQALLLPGLLAIAASFTATAYISFRGTTEPVAHQESDVKGALPTFISSVLPLIAVLGLSLGIGLDFPLAVVIGIVLALLIVPGKGFRPDDFAGRLKKGVLAGIDWHIVSAVAGIVFFSRVVVNSGAVPVLAARFSLQASSLLILAFAAPFLVGFITGSHQGAIGIVLPILLPLLSGQPNAHQLVALLYMASLAGYVISPAHVCLVGTIEYLKGDLAATWRLAWLPTGVLLIVTLVFGLIWV